MAKLDSTMLGNVKILLAKGAKGDGVQEVEEEIAKLNANVTELTQDMTEQFAVGMARIDNMIAGASLGGYTIQQHTFNIAESDWQGESPATGYYEFAISDLPEGSLLLGDIAGYKMPLWSDYEWTDKGVLTRVEITQGTDSVSISGAVWLNDIAKVTPADVDPSAFYPATLIVYIAVPSSGINTEVADIRVGYDGTTYQTAGDAVRSQIKNVRSERELNAYNIIPIRNRNLTTRGITFATNNDGSYIVTGTATSRANFNLLDSANSLPKGLQAGEKFKVYYNGEDKVQLQFFKYVGGTPSSTSFLNVQDDQSGGVEATIPADATGILIRLSVPTSTETGVTVTPLLVNAMTNKELTDKVVDLSQYVDETKKFIATNILPETETGRTHNGVTYTPVGDGSYEVSGTATSRSWLNIYDNANGFPDGMEVGKRFYIYYNGFGKVQLQLYKYVNGVVVSDPVFVNLNGDYTEKSFSVITPSDASGYNIRLSVPADTVIDTPVIVRPQCLDAKTSIELTEEVDNAIIYKSNVKYSAFGDSFTWSAVWDENPDTHSYQADFENQIPTRIASAIGAREFYNYGVGGSRFVARDVGEVTIGDKVKSVDLSDHNIITIGGGGNDRRATLGDGDTATANDGTLCGALADIFEYINANYPELQVVMYGVTPQPTTEAHAPSDIYTRVFEGGWSNADYFEEMRKMCRRYGVAFIDWYDCTLILQWGQLSGGYSSGVRNWSHPINQNIYKQLGNFLGGKVAGIYRG